MRKLTRRTATVVIAIGAVTGAGVALAAWTSSGSGSGSAGSITSVDSTITSDDFAADLYPGATSSVTVSIDNPNPYPVTVTSISAGSSDAVDGCAAGTVTSAWTSVSNTIAARSSESYTLSVAMSDDPSDACKSQTFTLPLTATLSSAAS